MAGHSNIPDGVTRDDIHGELIKILATPEFQRAPNRCKLLRYIVERSVEEPDPGGWLKESRLAEVVFNRIPFDPQDSIVRVTAKHLRKALKRFYETAGRYDLIVITIPRDRYVAVVERRDVDLAILFKDLGEVCPPDKRTRYLMKIADHQTSIAIDRRFEIHHSYQYKGWTENDMAFTFRPTRVPLPPDLRQLVKSYPPTPPNNRKFRLYRLMPESSERPILEMTLAPTDYFSTRPIQARLYEPILLDAGGQPCTPVEKYGRELLNFERCHLPNIICLHIIVVLPNNRLLLTQRVTQAGVVDWEAGRWSGSVEEQMNSTARVRPPDRSIFDTVRAGVQEELGYVIKNTDDVRILSIMMDPYSLVVEPVALAHASVGVDTIRGYWECEARDGKAELRNVIDVEWSIDRLIPILCGDDLHLGDTTISVADWHSSSRMRIAVSLFHKFGIESTLLALRDHMSKRRSH